MQDQPEESTPQEEIIERATDLPYNPEQEFTTAPVSIDPPREGMSRESPISKGKGHARDITPQSKRDPLPGNDKAESLCNLHHEIDWPSLVQMITHWSTQSNQSREEAASTQRELMYLQGRMTNLYNQLDEMLDAMNGIQELARHLCAKELEHPPVKKEEESPHTLASQALYADCGPTKDSAEYEQRQRVQVQFGKHPLPSTQERDKNKTPPTHQRDEGVENPQPSQPSPNEGPEEDNDAESTTTGSGDEEDKNLQSKPPQLTESGQLEREERYAINMAKSRSWLTLRGPQGRLRRLHP